MRYLISLLACVALLIGGAPQVSANPLIILSGSPPLIGGGPTFLLNEGFEGVGAPAGFGGAVDYEFAAPALAGAESVAFNDHGAVMTVTFAANDEIWIKFKLRIPALSETIPFISSPDASAVYMAIFTDGSATTDFVGTSAAGSFVAGTTYYFWAHYNGGTIWEVWWDTVDDRDAADNHLSNAAAAENTAGMFHGGALSTNAVIIDDYQVSTTDFQ